MNTKMINMVVKGQTVGVTPNGKIFGKRKELKQRIGADGVCSSVSHCTSPWVSTQANA